MVDRVRTSVTELLFKMQVARDAASGARAPAGRGAASAAAAPSGARGLALARARPSGGPRPRGADRRSAATIPCYCGSGKKYKKCCLAKGG